MSMVLVTGGAGFIGSHIVHRLLSLGHKPRVLDNFSSGHRENIADIASQFELIEGDIRDPAVCERAAEGAEVILHLGAIPSVPLSVDQPRDSHDANATGTFNILMAAKETGVKRVVYSASSAAYGDTPTLPKHETMTPAPLSPYAVAKLAGEHYCSCFAGVYGLETISLRYFNVFGARQDPNSQYAAVIPAFVTRMLAGQSPIVFGDGEQSRDFCYIDNVVDANLLAAGILPSGGGLERLSGEVVNIACGDRISLNRIIARINELIGTELKPDYQAARPGDVKHSLADISEAKRVIGYEPKIMLDEGLRLSIEWFKQSAR